MSQDNKKGNVVVKKTTKVLSSELQSNLKVKMIKHPKYSYIRLFVGSPVGETPYEVILHRPIGITDLDEDDWVLSEVSDMALLLAREEDPGAKKLQDIRLKVKIEKAVADNKIVDNDGILSYPGTGVERKVFLEPLRAEAKKLAKAHAMALQAQSGYEPSAPASKKKTDNDFFRELLQSKSEVDQNAMAELEFSEYMKSDELEEYAVNLHPRTFRTKGGTFAENSQRALDWAKGMSEAQVQRTLAKKIHDCVATFTTPK